MTDFAFLLTNLIVLILAPIAIFNLTLIAIAYFWTPFLEAWREKKLLKRRMWEIDLEARIERLEKKQKDNDPVS